MIGTAFLATAALAAAAPVGTGPSRWDAICDGRVAAAAELFEGEVRGLQQMRRWMGMPSSRAHILALMRSKAAHERSQRLDAGLDGPVTVREARYLKARDIDGYDVTDPYFRGARRATYGGLVILDDWPRMPMLGVYVTRDVAQVQRDLEQRAHGRFRIKVIRVRFSLRELMRIQDRIDWKWLAKRGIDVQSTGIGGTRVVLRATSTRADAAELVKKRFGPGIRVKISQPKPPREICVQAGGYTPSPDGLKLTVSGESDLSADVARVVLTETPTTVSVGIVQLTAPGISVKQYQFNTEVTLAAPLGTRQVLDGETGQPLPLASSVDDLG